MFSLEMFTAILLPALFACAFVSGRQLYSLLKGQLAEMVKVCLQLAGVCVVLMAGIVSFWFMG